MTLLQNFLFGAVALAHNLNISFQIILHQPLTWSFGLGFLVSTIAHGLLICGHPSHYLHILVYDKEKSFKKIHPLNDGSNYQFSYFHFSKLADHIKFVFALSILVFSLLILIALLRF